MLNKNAKEWVKALRSGKFKQTTGQLRVKRVGFCCLGVACQIAVEKGVIGKYVFDSLGLPNKVREWLGLATNSGSYKKTNLSDDNDVRKLTFCQIADIIESEPEGLFSGEKP
jgi:hypothetical protein